MIIVIAFLFVACLWLFGGVVYESCIAWPWLPEALLFAFMVAVFSVLFAILKHQNRKVETEAE